MTVVNTNVVAAAVERLIEAMFAAGAQNAEPSPDSTVAADGMRAVFETATALAALRNSILDIEKELEDILDGETGCGIIHDIRGVLGSVQAISTKGLTF